MAKSNQQSAVDVGKEHVADIYAKAFLGAAEAAGQTDQRLEEFDSFIDDVLDKNPAFEQMLSTLLVSDEDKLGIIDRVLAGRGSSELADFLKILAGRGRLDCLRAIRQAIHRQLNLMRGRREVEVRTATPIDEKLTQEIADAIRTRTGVEPMITQVVDPELLGGIVIKIDDIVCDGSVATSLKNLRSEMVSRSVEQIQVGRDRFVEDTASGA